MPLRYGTEKDKVIKSTKYEYMYKGKTIPAGTKISVKAVKKEFIEGGSTSFWRKTFESFKGMFQDCIFEGQVELDFGRFPLNDCETTDMFKGCSFPEGFKLCIDLPTDDMSIFSGSTYGGKPIQEYFKSDDLKYILARMKGIEGRVISNKEYEFNLVLGEIVGETSKGLYDLKDTLKKIVHGGNYALVSYQGFYMLATLEFSHWKFPQIQNLWKCLIRNNFYEECTGKYYDEVKSIENFFYPFEPTIPLKKYLEDDRLQKFVDLYLNAWEDAYSYTWSGENINQNDYLYKDLLKYLEGTNTSWLEGISTVLALQLTKEGELIFVSPSIEE